MNIILLSVCFGINVACMIALATPITIGCAVITGCLFIHSLIKY